LFWNFCVDHLSFAATEYMRSSDSDKETERFRKRADELMELATMASSGELDTTKPGQAIIEEWLPFTGQMFELPESILRNRLNDLVAAYISVKDSIHGEGPSGTGMPRRKTDTSSQSMRFESTDFEIKGLSLILKHPYPIVFLIPELATLKLKTPYTLSITRRALMGTGKFGPAEKEDTGSLMLTIRETH